MFCFYCFGHKRDLTDSKHAFPTCQSADIPAGRIKPGLFGWYAPLAKSTRLDSLEWAVAAMVQSEIVGAADRKKMFAKGDMEFRRTQGFDTGRAAQSPLRCAAQPAGRIDFQHPFLQQGQHVPRSACLSHH